MYLIKQINNTTIKYASFNLTTVLVDCTCKDVYADQLCDKQLRFNIAFSEQDCGEILKDKETLLECISTVDIMYNNDIIQLGNIFNSIKIGLNLRTFAKFNDAELDEICDIDSFIDALNDYLCDIPQPALVKLPADIKSERLKLLYKTACVMQADTSSITSKEDLQQKINLIFKKTS